MIQISDSKFERQRGSCAYRVRRSSYKWRAGSIALFRHGRPPASPGGASLAGRRWNINNSLFSDTLFFNFKFSVCLIFKIKVHGCICDYAWPYEKGKYLHPHI